MDSLYGLTYIPVDMDNLELAFKIQKEIWTLDPDYNDLLDKVYQSFVEKVMVRKYY